MMPVVIAAALNSGLRNGIGHINLVSDESATEDSVSSRIAYCAGMVRDAESDELCGDQFIGIRFATTQQTSGRDAPEVFLAWNVAVSKLTAVQKKHLLGWLRQWSQDRGELIEDCSEIRTNKTTVYSATLDAWAKTYCSNLPTFSSSTNPPAPIADDIKPSAPSKRFQMGRQLASVMLVLLFCVFGYVGSQLMGVVAPGDAQKPALIEKSNTIPVPPKQQHPSKAFDAWQSDLANLDVNLPRDPEQMQNSIGRLQDLRGRINEFPGGKGSSAAKEQVIEKAMAMRKILVTMVDSSISNEINELSGDFDAVNTESLRKTVETLNGIMQDLSALIPEMEVTGTAKSPDYVREVVDRKVTELVCTKCEYFGSKGSDFNHNDLNWLLKAAKSEAIINIVRQLSTREIIDRMFKAVKELDSDKNLIITVSDFAPRVVSVDLDFISEAEKVIGKSPCKASHAPSGKVESEKCFVGNVTMAELLQCKRISIRILTSSKTKEIFTCQASISPEILRHVITTQDPGTVTLVRKPFGSGRNAGGVSVQVSQELQRVFTTLHDLHDNAVQDVLKSVP